MACDHDARLALGGEPRRDVGARARSRPRDEARGRRWAPRGRGRAARRAGRRASHLVHVVDDLRPPARRTGGATVSRVSDLREHVPVAVVVVAGVGVVEERRVGALEGGSQAACGTTRSRGRSRRGCGTGSAAPPSCRACRGSRDRRPSPVDAPGASTSGSRRPRRVDREVHGHDGLALGDQDRSASSSRSPRGSARRRLSRRISSRRAMLASEVTVAMRKGRPSVVRPTSAHPARGRSRVRAPGSSARPGTSPPASGRLPGWKPRTDSGAGRGRPAAPARPRTRPRARAGERGGQSSSTATHARGMVSYARC